MVLGCLSKYMARKNAICSWVHSVAGEIPRKVPHDGLRAIRQEFSHQERAEQSDGARAKNRKK